MCLGFFSEGILPQFQLWIARGWHPQKPAAGPCVWCRACPCQHMLLPGLFLVMCGKRMDFTGNVATKGMRSPWIWKIWHPFSDYLVIPCNRKQWASPNLDHVITCNMVLGKLSTGKLGMCSVYRVRLDTKTGVVCFFFSSCSSQKESKKERWTAKWTDFECGAVCSRLMWIVLAGRWLSCTTRCSVDPLYLSDWCLPF